MSNVFSTIADVLGLIFMLAMVVGILILSYAGWFAPETMHVTYIVGKIIAVFMLLLALFFVSVILSNKLR